MFIKKLTREKRLSQRRDSVTCKKERPSSSFFTTVQEVLKISKPKILTTTDRVRI